VYLSDAAANLIKSFERFRPTAYKPTKDDVWTIGYGHTEDVKEGDTCTMDQANAWLEQDMKHAENALNELLSDMPITLTQNQVDALGSLVYNIGYTNFRLSSIRRELRRGNLKIADDPVLGFAGWKRQDGKTLNGLIARRAAELKLWHAA
jgi:lysozyme